MTILNALCKFAPGLNFSHAVPGVKTFSPQPPPDIPRGMEIAKNFGLEFLPSFGA
jgi:hypothetical protein